MIYNLVSHFECVQCGYCCSKVPCCYGEWDYNKKKCKFLTSDTKCAKYDEIIKEPDSNIMPAFGAGCSSAAFNTVRENKIKERKCKRMDAKDLARNQIVSLLNGNLFMATKVKETLKQVDLPDAIGALVDGFCIHKRLENGVKEYLVKTFSSLSTLKNKWHIKNWTFEFIRYEDELNIDSHYYITNFKHNTTSKNVSITPMELLSKDDAKDNKISVLIACNNEITNLANWNKINYNEDTIIYEKIIDFEWSGIEESDLDSYFSAADTILEEIEKIYAFMGKE